MIYKAYRVASKKFIKCLRSVFTVIYIAELKKDIHKDIYPENAT